MKIEVAEINKISLAKDELLFIKLPRCSTKVREMTRDELFKNLSEEWIGRVCILNSDVEIIKIKKEK